jgi:hypothetical protein
MKDQHLKTVIVDWLPNIWKNTKKTHNDFKSNSEYDGSVRWIIRYDDYYNFVSVFVAQHHIPLLDKIEYLDPVGLRTNLRVKNHYRPTSKTLVGTRRKNQNCLTASSIAGEN